jgi:hypothetical protein
MYTSESRVMTGEQVLSSELQLSHVVVLPYTSRVIAEAGSLHTELSWPSEIALHAATIASNQHDAKLVVIGEDDHERLDSTTKLTVERAPAYGVDEDSVWPVDKLRNGKSLNGTYRQIAGAAERLASVESPSVLTVAFDAHLPRVMKASQGANLLSSFASVEEVLKAANVHDYDDMLPVIAGIARTERIKRIIGGKRGILFNALIDAHLVSHVYLDFDEATGTLIEMSARKHRKQAGGKLLDMSSTAATE